MFKKLLTSLSVAFILTLSGVSVHAKIIKNPSFDARTSSILTVEEIDLGKKETRMKFRAVFRPNWWFSVDSTEYILDPATGEKFYPTAIEGIKFGERVTMPQSADTVFTIVYPPLPKKTKTLDLFPESSWKTFGLSLSGKKSSRKESPADTPVASRRIPIPSFFTEGNMHLHGKINGIPHYVLITPEGLVYDKKFGQSHFFTVLRNEGIPFNTVTGSANNIIIHRNDE